jgi:hypothetical protein
VVPSWTAADKLTLKITQQLTTANIKLGGGASAMYLSKYPYLFVALLFLSLLVKKK